MSLRNRYEYYPQMEQYDALRLASKFVPYLMFMSQSNFSSDVVNTDSNFIERPFITHNK